MDQREGHLEPGVAQSWQQKNPVTWQLSIRKSVTRSDGSAMDAQTVADGLKNPGMLAGAGDGSGPYVVQSVTPGDHITYKLRKGYNWGPTGYQSTSAAGLPPKATVKIVSNATTMANLLLNGQVNVASVGGQDQKRLEAQKLFKQGINSTDAQVWYNHSGALATADVNVRCALTMGLDMKQIVPAVSQGQGGTVTGLAPASQVCPTNTVAGNLPSHNVAQAKSPLAKAGYTAAHPLNITLLCSSDVTNSVSAAQVIASEWKAIGVDVTLNSMAAQQVVSGVFGASLKWDALVLPVGVTTPSQLVPFVSGATVPKGQNFSFIDNKTYDSLTTKAADQAGTAGCPDWVAAEKALLKDADVDPTGRQSGYRFANGAH